MFKNSWFSEGTARWSEALINMGIVRKQKLPTTIKQLNNDFLNQTYKTDVYWNQMAYLCSKKKSNKLHGYDFIENILEDFGKKDKQVTKEMNYEKYKWSEKDQKSIKNNSYMLCSIKETLLKNCSTINSEVKKFIHVIDEYTKGKCK